MKTISLTLISCCLLVPLLSYGASNDYDCDLVSSCDYYMYGEGNQTIPLRWLNTETIYYYLKDTTLTTSHQSEINNSFQKWEDIKCDGTAIKLTAENGGTRTNSINAQDEVNMVSIVTHAEFTNVPDTADALAYCQINGYSYIGTLIEADIVVDKNTIDSGYVLESVLIHEIGHFFGLDHSAASSSIMYFQYTSGSTNLSKEDAYCLYENYSAIPAACSKNLDCANGESCLIDITPSGAYVGVCKKTIGSKAAGQTCSKNEYPTACEGGLCYPSIDCTSATCSTYYCISPCASDSDCPSGNYCIEFDTNLNTCFKIETCDENADCGSGEICTIFTTGMSYVASCGPSEGTKTTGTDCRNASECYSGLCKHKKCSEMCATVSTCPADWTCEQTDQGDLTYGYCHPPEATAEDTGDSDTGVETPDTAQETDTGSTPDSNSSDDIGEIDTGGDSSGCALASLSNHKPPVFLLAFLFLLLAFSLLPGRCLKKSRTQ